MAIIDNAIRHQYRGVDVIVVNDNGESPTQGIRPDTVGEPRVLVFIVLIRNFGRERRGEDLLTEREALAPCHISEDRLFLLIYYIKLPIRPIRFQLSEFQVAHRE